MNLAQIIGNIVTGKNLAMRQAPTGFSRQKGDLAMAGAPTKVEPGGAVEGGLDLLSGRPEEMPVRDGFAGMTPLQSRTKIASGALQGQGEFLGPDTQKFYRDVAFYSLLDPQGTPAANDAIVPIERKYVKNVLGRDTGDTTETFLQALMRG